MLDRLMGVAMLKAPVYRDVAHDKSATTTAGIITVVMAIFGGVLGAVMVGAAGSFLPADQLAQLGSPVRLFFSTIVNTLIGWVVGSFVFGFVANMFGGKTDTGEMLRVFGFSQIFQLLNIVPCIGGLAALVLSIIGAIIGIREAAGFDTTKAILTGVVGFVALVIVSIVVGMFLAIFGL